MTELGLVIHKKETCCSFSFSLFYEEIVYLHFDDGRGCVVLPAHILPGNDGQSDVGRMEPILTFTANIFFCYFTIWICNTYYYQLHNVLHLNYEADNKITHSSIMF